MNLNTNPDNQMAPRANRLSTGNVLKKDFIQYEYKVES